MSSSANSRRVVVRTNPIELVSATVCGVDEPRSAGQTMPLPLPLPLSNSLHLSACIGGDAGVARQMPASSPGGALVNGCARARGCAAGGTAAAAAASVRVAVRSSVQKKRVAALQLYSGPLLASSRLNVPGMSETHPGLVSAIAV